MRSLRHHKPWEHNSVKLLFVSLLILSLTYDVLEFWSMKNSNQNLTRKIENLETENIILSQKLLIANNQNASIAKNLEEEKANSSLFQSQIQSITSTVNTLDKLSKTDEKLLQKYSKVYFLNENYTPENLVLVDPIYLFTKDKTTQILAGVWPHLKALLDYATSSKIDLQVVSGYRSFGTQANLKSNYKVTYGAGTANKFSADQGYSEHQLGTTIDFTDKSTGANLVGFEKTESYKWLLDNAHKYGFTLSYPEENTYYQFEPWHFRYVGVELATRLHNEKKPFYELDQREIDSYLVNLFD